jgi:hypothetical protein
VDSAACVVRTLIDTVLQGCEIILRKPLPTRQRIRKVRIRCRGRQALPAVKKVEKPSVCQEVSVIYWLD